MSTATALRKSTEPGLKGRWWRFAIITVFTAIILVPIAAVVVLSLRPPAAAGLGGGPTLDSFIYILTFTDALGWMRNSLLVVTLSTIAAVAVAAPAGYVLSRGRSRAVSAYSLTLFVVQSFPTVVFVIPLFVLFAHLGLADTLLGVGIAYVATTISVCTWMMAAYFDSIPTSLEEAAWVDGTSVFGGFLRVVLRNSLPGILSTAIFAFLLSWNDYLIATVFLRSALNYTLPVGVQTFFQQNSTDWGSVMAVAVLMMVPPILIFAVLNRYFSVGGIGGALTGR